MQKIILNYAGKEIGPETESKRKQMADSRTGTEKVQRSLGHPAIAEVKKCSKKQQGHVTRTKEAICRCFL